MHKTLWVILKILAFALFWFQTDVARKKSKVFTLENLCGILVFNHNDALMYLSKVYIWMALEAAIF